MNNTLVKLETSKQNFENYFSKRFNKELENKLREETNKSLRKKIEFLSNTITYFMIFTPIFIFSLCCLYNISKGYDGSILYVLAYIWPCIGGYLGMYLSEIYERIANKNIAKILDVEILKAKKRYLNDLICSITEIKHHYDLLIECLGEDELNKKIIKLGTEKDEIGSYNFILKLFNNAIEEEKNKNLKGNDLCKQLKLIYNKK